MDNKVRVLVEYLDAVFYGPGWHGPELYPTLQELSLVQLQWSDPREGLSAWKLALHCAYWKHVVTGRLVDQQAPFARPREDWPEATAGADREAWEADLQLLVDMHEELKRSVRYLDPDKLALPVVGNGGEERMSNEALILSIAAHDAYHTAHIRNFGIPGFAPGKRAL